MKMKKARILALVLALAMMFVLVAACVNDDQPATTPEATPEATPDATPVEVEDDDDEEPGDSPVVTAPEATVQDTLTVVTAALPVDLLPWGQNDNPSAQVRKQIFDTLFVLDYNTFEVIPELSLAVSWDQPDASTTNIEIRQGVTFHDGTPLTAEDVKFSLEMSGSSDSVAAILGMLDRVEVHDDYNLTVYTEFDFAPIIRHLSHTASGITSRAHYEANGEDGLREHPIGSGPFVFDMWALGDRVELTRNENWWGNVPAIERVIIREVGAADVRLLEVQTGTADLALDLAPADVPMAEASPDVELLRRATLSIGYIGFNVNAPHIDNPLVRQAINYALDSHAVVEHVFMGLGQSIDGPMAPNVWGFAAQEPFDTSIDRARELLEEAGYNTNPGEDGGFSTSIWYNDNNAQRGQIAEMLQFTLAQLNIDVEVIGVEWGQYLADTAAGEHDMFILGWVGVTGDADYSLFPLFHTSLFGDAGNRTFWGTPELDELLERGRSEVDPAVRLEIYAEAQEIVRNEAPWVFLNQTEMAIAANPNLRNFVINPALHHSYAPIFFVADGE